MDAKLKMAIEKWRKVDSTAFQKELELLYKSLVEALQDMPGPIDEPEWETQETPEMLQTQPVSDFLTEESQHMDSCVRWHLLRLAIHNARSGSSTGTSNTATINVHLQLAKAIMACDSAGENLLFYSPTGNKISSQCKWSSGGKHLEPAKQQLLQKQQQSTDQTNSATKKQGKVMDAPAVAKTTPARANANTNVNANASAHFGGKSNKAVEKTLFATAVCEGHPHVGALLAEAKELLCRKPSTETITGLARRNVKNLHSDLAAAHKTAPPAFRQVLHEVRDFLKPEDNVLLGRVIDDPLPNLASVILASENHAALLTTHERIVQAIDKWMAEARQKIRGVRPAGHQSNVQDDDNNDDDDDGRDDDDDDDDNDDDDGPFGDEDGNDNENDSLANPQRSGKKSKTDRRRGLAHKALTHAPEAVLRSPEVLTALMRYNLLEDADIILAYTRNVHRLASKTPPTSAFASFLDKVPGILHMAVLFQQQPLVETLLRRAPLLAVTREYVRTTTADGGTIPEKKEKKPSAETATAAVNGANGTKGASGVPRDQKADSGCYPLWFNNEAIRPGSPYVVQEKDDAKWKQIRSALIYCTMKHAENVQTLLTILRESGEPEHEINFDMSRLLIEGTSVADFVTSMPRRGRSHSLIRYEETIRYAEFPVLDLSTQPQTPAAQNQQRSHLERTHREILDILEWLYEHGVRRIITLRVPDRMAHPHDELEIAVVVRRFRVEELDWRILDLSLNIFGPHGGPDDIPLVCYVDNDTDEKTRTDKAKDDKTCLTRLHLYTGGRRSALDHWFSAEGLESMKLDYVLIHVIKELTTKKQSDATVRYIRAKIDELKKRKPTMQMDVLPQFWTSQTETPRLQEIIHHLSPRLAQFIAYYRQIADECHVQHKSFRPAKVAIIDNGILSMDPPNAPRAAGRARTDAAPDVHSNNNSSSSSSSERHLHSQDFLTADSLWSRICDGKSFVHEQDRVSPWYLASNPHGTQMANLVCAIDPLCQLFVAKIADGHYGYSAARAAEAVEWAIKKGVDIISMSFTTTENHDPFNDAVGRAMKSGILVVCSHHDEGARIGTEVFPASLGGTAMDTMLRMASCNMYGKLQHDWDDNTVDEASKKINQYDFCINSQDIAVGAIPFLAASTEHISGSSVATAIAAGVCSLLIACLRTLHVVPFIGLDKLDPVRDRTIKNMRDNVTRALATGNRPAYADIKTYLATMAPSTTNPRFISLDRFARLDELRDVNTISLSNAFFALGAKFTVK